jgi:hypothetical protein
MGLKNGQKKDLLQLYISVNEHTFEGDIVTSCAHEEIPHRRWVGMLLVLPVM